MGGYLLSYGAYLPSCTAQSTYSNISNFDASINGIMVDLKGVGNHSAITLGSITNDFTFKVCNNNSPGSWVAAQPPSPCD